jgi:DNA replication protein DnaC
LNLNRTFNRTHLNLTEFRASEQQLVIAQKDHTDWAYQAGNILLIGPSGVGKSHIAAALAAQLIEHNVRVKWFSAVALVQSLQQAKRDPDLMTAITRLDKYQVLVIDDIGYVKKNDAETQCYSNSSLIVMKAVA